MSQGTGLVSPAWVTKLVEATFGGAPPAGVDAYVDPVSCGAQIMGAKCGMVFTVGADESPRVRIAHDGEAERLAELTKSTFPAAAAWVASHEGKDLLYETDGTWFRGLVTGIETKVPGAIGEIWEDGKVLHLVMSEGIAAELPAGQAAAAKAFLDGIDAGMFVRIEHEGALSSFLYVSEGAWNPGLAERVANLGPGAKRNAAAAVYAEAGLHVHPYSVQFDVDGGIQVCLWGAFQGTSAGDLPGIFQGTVPDATSFAGELVQVLPDEDREPGIAFVRDTLFPTFAALAERGKQQALHIADVWRFLIDQLALEAPFDRLALLRRLHAANRPAVIQERAFALAVARYLQTHPDAEPPAWLPADLVGAQVPALTTEAQGLSDEARALQASLSDVEDPAVFLMGEDTYDFPTLFDLLDRAQSGVFAAAEGPLHDFLVGLGATGYDDDPSMVNLEDIDLEADAAQQAIEEALMMDDEDEL